MKLINVDFAFDRLHFAHDLEVWRAKHELTIRECDDMMETKNWWSNVVSENTSAYRDDYLPRMFLFIKACNLCDLDPRDYFSFSDRMVKNRRTDK